MSVYNKKSKLSDFNPSEEDLEILKKIFAELEKKKKHLISKLNMTEK